MWGLNHKEGWMTKNWYFWTAVLEKTWDSLGLIKLVHPKGNRSWIFIRRTGAEAEAPILWPIDGKIWLIRKDPDVGKDLRQKEKGVTEEEMALWHHWLNGHEFEHWPGDGQGQGSLVCCSPWDRKESGTTEWLNSGIRRERLILSCPINKHVIYKLWCMFRKKQTEYRN